MRIPFSATAVLALVIAACTFPTTGCGCSPPEPLFVAAVGSVRTAAGAPVTTAILSIGGTRGNCSAAAAPRVTFLPLEYSIDSAGRYRARIIPTQTDSICVTITARRNANAGADSVAGPPFSFAVGAPQKPDSVIVNLTLP